MTRRGVALALLFLLLTACGRTPAQRRGQAGSGQVRTVEVDGRVGTFNGAFLAYFPSQVHVGPGDAVEFRAVWTGEPHTVALGSVVERALDAYKASGAGAPEVAGLPHESLSGPRKVIPSVATPCVVPEGMPPTGDQPCPKLEKVPPFNGRQAYYSTGMIVEHETFTVRLAQDIAPGTYRYVCSVHGPRMQGAIVVEAKGADIPGQSELEDTIRKERRALIDTMRDKHRKAYDSFRRARSGQFPYPARAGLVSSDGRVLVNEFIPFTIKAKVNERVRWVFEGDHTISFDVPRRARPPAIERLLDNTVERTPEAIEPFGGPKLPTGVIGGPTAISGGRYNKEGFLNTGLVRTAAPGLATFVMVPTEPGTYKYECLVHPRMTGLITVTS